MNAFDDFFDHDWFFKPVLKDTNWKFSPVMDLHETDDAYVAKVDLPGLTKEDIHIEVSNDVLTISGERKNEMDEKKDGWDCMERQYGKFSRAIRVPSDTVDSDKITANYKNGVLEVSLPKAAQVKPKEILVGTN